MKRYDVIILLTIQIRKRRANLRARGKIYMKNNSIGALIALILAAFLNGCGFSGGSQDSGIPEIGSSDGIDYSGTSGGIRVDDTDSAPESTTASRTGANTAPEQTTTSGTTKQTASAATKKPETTSSTSKPADTTQTTSKPAKTTSRTTQTAKPEEKPDTGSGARDYKALNYSEVKGIWISYIELADVLQGQTAEGFRRGIAGIFDNCVSLGINTAYVHVRSHGDAYYRSELFPWTKYAAGSIGKDPGYDPLEIMTEEAHSRGISFQAWINPLRACGTSQISGYKGYPVYTYATAGGMAGKYAVDVNGTYYLNPAYDEVTKYIADGAAEIVSNYDVDGLHIDDYFYPTTDASFDSSAFKASGASSLEDFRFANCDRMVSELYSAVRESNSTAVFSVSVQGRIENNYTQLYADVRKWCTTPGYLDMMIPQIYYGFENSAAPYKSTLDDWEALGVKGGIPIVAGLSVSKAGCEDKWAGSGKYEWINNSDIISRQLAEARKCQSYGGFALYSYRSVFAPESTVSAAVNREISALKELI